MIKIVNVFETLPIYLIIAKLLRVMDGAENFKFLKKLPSNIQNRWVNLVVYRWSESFENLADHDTNSLSHDSHPISEL